MDAVNVPRKNPVPEREVGICKRLREFRLSRGQSQVFFAQRLGIDATMLASLEHARAPLRYYIAFNLFKHYPLNPHWLATGKGDRDSWFLIPNPDELSGCPIRAPYSNVYDQYLQNTILAEGISVNAIFCEPSSGELTARASDPDYRIEVEMNYIKRYVKDWFAKVSDEDFEKFVKMLIEDGARVFQYCKQDRMATSMRRAEKMNKLGPAAGMF